MLQFFKDWGIIMKNLWQECRANQTGVRFKSKSALVKSGLWLKLQLKFNNAGSPNRRLPVNNIKQFMSYQGKRT